MSSFAHILSVLGLVPAHSVLQDPRSVGERRARRPAERRGVLRRSRTQREPDRQEGRERRDDRGHVVDALKGGASVSLTVAGLLTNAGLVGTACLAYEVVNRLRKAVFA